MNTNTSTATLPSIAAAPGVAAANAVLEEATKGNGATLTLLDPTISITQDTSRLEQLEAERVTVLKRIEESRKAAVAAEHQKRMARIEAITDQMKALPVEDLKVAFLALRTQLSAIKHGGKAKVAGNPSGAAHRNAPSTKRRGAAKTSTSTKAVGNTRNRVTAADTARMVEMYNGGVSVTEIERKMHFSRQTIYRYLREGGCKIGS